MAGWRDEVRRPPAAGVAPQRDAEIVLQRALAARRRTRMSMAAMGSVAAALLCLGGFGAVVYGAGPGDALYGLRTSLFGEQQVTRDDQVALAAQTEMQQVQQLIDQGNWDAAQDKLQTVTSTVQTVEDPQRQQELQQQLNQLSVKVETRDPDATVPARARRPPIAPQLLRCRCLFSRRRPRRLDCRCPDRAGCRPAARIGPAAARTRAAAARCRCCRCRCRDPVCRRMIRRRRSCCQSRCRMIRSPSRSQGLRRSPRRRTRAAAGDRSRAQARTGVAQAGRAAEAARTGRCPPRSRRPRPRHRRAPVIPGLRPRLRPRRP